MSFKWLIDSPPTPRFVLSPLALSVIYIHEFIFLEPLKVVKFYVLSIELNRYADGRSGFEFSRDFFQPLGGKEIFRGLF